MKYTQGRAVVDIKSESKSVGFGIDIPNTNRIEIIDILHCLILELKKEEVAAGNKSLHVGQSITITLPDWEKEEEESKNYNPVEELG